jgi:ketosteroid isomerase-like protein
MTAINDLLTDWASAECNGDVSTLDRLLTDDFAGIGPLGFVLPKHAWLVRFEDGLTYDRFELDEIQSRYYGDAAVVTARQIADGTVSDNPLPFETLRATLTLICRHDRWQLAAIHMSFVAGTRGAPPLPSAARHTPGTAAVSDADANHG